MVTPSSGINPFTIPDLDWSKVEIDEDHKLIANGRVNGTGLSFGYSRVDTSDSLSTYTFEEDSIIGTSLSKTQVRGNYNNGYSAFAWSPGGVTVSADQSIYTAEIRSNGWYRTNDSFTQFFDADGKVIRETEASDQLLNGWQSNKSFLKLVTRENGTNEISRTVLEREIDTSSVDHITNESYGTYTPIPLPAPSEGEEESEEEESEEQEWFAEAVYVDNKSDFTTTINADRLKVRKDIDFKRAAPVEVTNGTSTKTWLGYDQFESNTTEGEAKTSTGTFLSVVDDQVLFDEDTYNSSFKRKDSVTSAGLHDYKYETHSQLYLIDEGHGVETYSNNRSGTTKESFGTTDDYVEQRMVTTSSIDSKGIDKRSVSDDGEWLPFVGPKTEYSSDQDIDGQFETLGSRNNIIQFYPDLQSNGKSWQEFDHTKLFAVEYSPGKISTSRTTSGPNRFTESRKKETTMGIGNRVTQDVDLMSIDGVPYNGYRMAEDSKSTVGDLVTESVSGTVAISAGTQSSPILSDLTKNLMFTLKDYMPVNSVSSKFTYTNGVRTEENDYYAHSLGWTRTIGNTTEVFTYPIAQTKTVEYVPLLTNESVSEGSPQASSDGANVSTRFDHLKKQTQYFAVNDLVSGDFLESRSDSKHYKLVEEITTPIVGMVGLTEGNEWKNETIELKSLIWWTDDSKVTDGEWGKNQRHYGSRVSSKITGDYGRDATGFFYAPVMVNGMTTNEKVGTFTNGTRNTGETTHSEVITNGVRGRGKDEQDRVVTNSVTTHRLAFGNTSSSFNGNSSSGHSMTASHESLFTSDTFETRDGIEKRVAFATSNHTHGFSEAFGQSSSPNGWSQFKSASNFNNQYVRNGKPGDWVGFQVQHTTGSYSFKSNTEPEWVTTPTGSGSATPVIIGSHLEQPSWWSDTWVSAGWSELSTTWFGQSVHWVWANIWDVVRIGFGAVEVLSGAAMSLSGFAAVPGVALTAIGIDNVLTGFFNIRYGQVGQGLSVFESGVYAVTGNTAVSVLLPAIASGSLYRLGRGAINAAMQSSEGMSALARGPLTRDLRSSLNYLVQRYPDMPIFGNMDDLVHTAERFTYIFGHGRLYASGGTYTALIGSTRWTPRELANALKSVLPSQVTELRLLVCYGAGTRWYGLVPSMAWEIHVRTGLKVLASPRNTIINSTGRMVVRNSADTAWLPFGQDLRVFDSWWRVWGRSYR